MRKGLSGGLCAAAVMATFLYMPADAQTYIYRFKPPVSEAGRGADDGTGDDPVATPITITLGSHTFEEIMEGKSFSFPFEPLASISRVDPEATAPLPAKSTLTWALSASGAGQSAPTDLTLSAGPGGGVLSGLPKEGEYTFDVVASHADAETAGRQTYTIKVGAVALEVAQIHTGHNFACALTSSGAVKCWGANNVGQLGNGTGVASSTPVTVPGLESGVTSIGGGVSHTCAVVGGGVSCWGHGARGQLGNSGTGNRLTPAPVRNDDNSGNLTGVASIGRGVGNNHTCVIMVSRSAKCWGRNNYGQLGNTPVGGDIRLPVNVVNLAGVDSITMGGDTSCAIVSGAATCWGYGVNGSLGNGVTYDATTTGTYVPVPVSGLDSGVSQITIGRVTSCAIHKSAAKCWGSNMNTQIGNGDANTGATYNTPQDVSILGTGVTSISGGHDFMCAVRSGAAWCWGLNGSGQLGSGGGGASSPIPVTALSSGVGSVSAGLDHACASTSAGLKCWGSNDSGETGRGDGGGTVVAPAPVKQGT